MQKDSLQNLLILAKDIALTASNEILNDFSQNRHVHENFRRDVKILADNDLDRFIVEQLSQISEFPVLSEESGLSQASNSKENYRWIVDPLDGSMNYSRGIPICCISIAFWQDMNPLIGVVYDFNRDELFTGIVGEGAWLNDSPICVSSTENTSNAILATGFPVSSDFSEKALYKFVNNIKKYKKIRLLGSAALSLAYVSSGRVDVYQENDIKIWDVAAGIALVRAAGGMTKLTPSKVKEIVTLQAYNSNLKDKNSV
jgi:myo-inositol-1(or 4)-monophosphatase